MTPGLEALEATFGGHAFDPHAHDTYAIGVTARGDQCFRYRGEARRARAGDVIVLHPDETHDGEAGGPEGFAYRMVYAAPAWLAGPFASLGLRTLPFAPCPVVRDPGLAAAVLRAFDQPEADGALEDLRLTDLAMALARGLARRAERSVRPARLDRPALARARQALEVGGRVDDGGGAVPDAGALERLTDLDRFSLSRQFRAAYGTSPHRYATQRRLQAARAAILAGDGLADVASAFGFCDQAHLTRQFKRAYGLTPGRLRRLVGGGTTETDR